MSHNYLFAASNAATVCRLTMFGLAISLTSVASNAQSTEITPHAPMQMATIELPDAPSAVLRASILDTEDAAEPIDAGSPGTWQAPDFGFERTRPERKLHRTIPPNQMASPLTAGDKFKLSVRSRFSIIEIGTTAFTAGLSQLRDSRPHYGTDAPAFGERFGASELKHATSSFLSYGVYATALHEDPRYYVMGRKQKVLKRAVYSATRLLITRTDAGKTTPNFSKLLGVASSNALTNLYYPEQDRGAKPFVQMFGSSMYGTVINNELHEFLPDLKALIFHRNK